METEFNTIKDALSDMTKVGLDRLRKFSGYKIKSNLKKAGLVDALEAALKADPVTFLNKLPIFDLILLRSACRTPQDSVAAFDALVDMNYIELFNIVNYDFDDGKGEEYIWGNEEFSNLFSPFIDDVIDDMDRKGRTLIDYFVWGMLSLYGCPTLEDFMRVIKKEFGKKEEDWWPIWMQVIKYAPAMDLMDGDGFMVNPSMGEVDKVMEDMRERGFDRKPQKEYSFKEIVDIGATGPHFVFGQGTKEYQNAMAALKRCGLDESKAKSKLSIAWFMVQNAMIDNRPTEIIKEMIGTPTLSSVDELNAIIQPLMEYMNRLPRWMLGGRAPKDIPVPKEALGQIAAMGAVFGQMHNMMGYQGVGRNDPCPCGSGLKYKNCHGKSVS